MSRVLLRLPPTLRWGSQRPDSKSAYLRASPHIGRVRGFLREKPTKGISIHRAYSRRLSRKGTRSRLTNGATVAAITFINLIRRKKPDVVLVDSTSPFLLVVAWLVLRLRGVPYVFLVHDVYPEIAVQLGIVGPRSITARLWRRIYRRIYLAAARIVVLGLRMRDVVRESIDSPEQWYKLKIIPNWTDGDTIVPRAKEENPLRDELGLTDKLVVLYSGNMGLAHDMETIVEASDRLRDLSDLRFLFIGDGGKRDWLAATVQQRELTNVVMLPYQPQEKLPYSMTCGDISLITLKRGMEGLLVPSKIYSSLAAGLAIIAVMEAGSEVGDIVEDHECGYRMPQGDVDGLVAAITALHENPSLLAEMQRRSRACFDAKYTREMSIERYAEMLRSVANASSKAQSTVEANR